MITNSKYKHTTHTASSKKKWVVIFGLLFLVIGGAYMAYMLGKYIGNAHSATNTAMIKDLQTKNTTLNTALSKVEKELARTDRKLQIQQSAYQELQNNYRSLEKTRQLLTSKVDFFVSILSPKNKGKGPAIRTFTSKGKTGNIDFELGLIQALDHRKQIRGRLTVEVFQNDKRLAVWPESGERPVNYKYFFTVSGNIKADYVRERKVRIKVTLALPHDKVLERWFDLETDS